VVRKPTKKLQKLSPNYLCAENATSMPISGNTSRETFAQSEDIRSCRGQNELELCLHQSIASDKHERYTWRKLHQPMANCIPVSRNRKQARVRASKNKTELFMKTKNIAAHTFRMSRFILCGVSKIHQQYMIGAVED